MGVTCSMTKERETTGHKESITGIDAWSLKIRALVSPSMSNNICGKDVTQTFDTRQALD